LGPDRRRAARAKYPRVRTERDAAKTRAEKAFENVGKEIIGKRALADPEVIKAQESVDTAQKDVIQQETDVTSKLDKNREELNRLTAEAAEIQKKINQRNVKYEAATAKRGVEIDEQVKRAKKARDKIDTLSRNPRTGGELSPKGLENIKKTKAFTDAEEELKDANEKLAKLRTTQKGQDTRNENLTRPDKEALKLVQEKIKIEESAVSKLNKLELEAVKPARERLETARQILEAVTKEAEVRASSAANKAQLQVEIKENIEEGLSPAARAFELASQEVKDFQNSIDTLDATKLSFLNKLQNQAKSIGIEFKRLKDLEIGSGQAFFAGGLGGSFVSAGKVSGGFFPAAAGVPDPNAAGPTGLADFGFGGQFGPQLPAALLAAGAETQQDINIPTVSNLDSVERKARVDLSKGLRRTTQSFVPTEELSAGLAIKKNSENLLSVRESLLSVGKALFESEKGRVATTKEALDAAIEVARPGIHLSDLSAKIQDIVESAGFNVVRDFAGHGIGKNLHESPDIPNFGKAGQGPILKEGMTLAIEPMITQGHWGVKIEKDGWTAKTEDESLSAHIEDTIVITKNGVEVLTRL